MSDYLPVYQDDNLPVTMTLSGTVAGGQLVTVAGAAAGSAATTVAGVAGRDGVSGDQIPVWGPGKHRGTASGSIAQGDPLCAGAGGTVRTWVSGTDAVASLLGRAWSAATNGQSVVYSLFGV